MVEHERRCEICNRLLSRYNLSGSCSACTVAARCDPAFGIQVPPIVWYDAKVRYALSRWEWRTVLTAVIDHTGATQTQLAEATGLSQAHISRLISGKGQCYDIRTVNRIVDGLGAPRTLAGLASTFTTDGNGYEIAEEIDTVHRRDFLAMSAASPFVVTFDGVGSQITAQHARSVRETVPQLYRLDDQFGGDVVSEIAIWCTRQVDRLLNTADYSESTGRELQVTYGELTEMSGWLHFDAGRYAQAQARYGEALQAARLADDLNLEVLVLASMNMLARYRGRPREGVQLAQLAQRRAAGWAPPRLKSLLAARESVCLAQLGDEAAATSAMHRAYHIFHPDVEADDPAWLEFFDVAELAAYRSTASMYMRRIDQAAKHMRTAVDGLREPFRRNRAMYTIRLGLNYLALGDETQACQVVSSVLPLLSEVRSGRAHARFAEFRNKIHNSRNRQARQLMEKVHGLNLAGAMG